MLRQLNLALGKQGRHSLRRAFASSSSSSPGGAAAAKMDTRGNNAQHSILNQEDLLQTPRSTIMFQTVDEPGSLEHAIRLFWKNDINMTRIESKPSTKSTSKYDFIVDFEGTQDMEQAQNLIKDLRRTCVRVEMVDAKTVPWFPQSLSDLDYCVLGTLDAGAELESDHPGFNDHEYRERRKEIADWAYSFKNGDPVPRINYTDTETRTCKYLPTKETTLSLFFSTWPHVDHG